MLSLNHCIDVALFKLFGSTDNTNRQVNKKSYNIFSIEEYKSIRFYNMMNKVRNSNWVNIWLELGLVNVIII